MAVAANKAEDRHQIRFVCRRCQQPLKIDLSFDNIHEQNELVNELTAPLIAQADRDSEPLIPEKAQFYEEDANLSRRTIEPRYTPTDDSYGFTLLGETGPLSLGTLGHKPKVKAVLFDVMTGQSTIDHPLCEECTDTLLNNLDDQLKITEEECRDYRNFLERLDSSSQEEDDAALDDELLKLKAEEQVLREQLKQVAAEQDQVHKDILREREKSKQLHEEEERYWREYNEYKRQVQELDDEQRSVDNQLKYAQAQLDRLKKTNVFNATFHIWHSGHFGTINNFRLGRLKSVPVEWSEINAAWGQTVLLLHSLAKKMNLTFKRYRLVPYGSHSYLESLTDKSKELPLYGSGGFRFFWDAKFDQAMVAFLDCVQQFKEEVEKGDSQFCLPYRMEKDRIEDNTTSGQSYSIKIQFNSEEKWTKALKFMLTNLKWGLAWVSSQFANK